MGALETDATASKDRLQGLLRRLLREEANSRVGHMLLVDQLAQGGQVPGGLGAQAAGKVGKVGKVVLSH